MGGWVGGWVDGWMTTLDDVVGCDDHDHTG